MIEKTNVMLISVSVFLTTSLFFAMRYLYTQPVVNVSNDTIDKYKDL